MAKGNPNRQKMINMMYLVLTALLALNISKQVLKAFELVNNGLENTNKGLTGTNTATYETFTKQWEQQKAKAQPLYDKAQKVKAESKELFDYIENMKTELVTNPKYGNGYEHPEEKADLRNQDNVEVGQKYFGADKAVGGLAKGEEMRSRLQKYKEDMKVLVPQVSTENIDTEKEKKEKSGGEMVTRKWEEFYFLEYPLISNITMLNRFQNEVKNTEGNLVKYLLSQIGATDYKFDNLRAIVSAKNPVVLEGQKYEAEIFLGAYDSKSNPDIIVNGAASKVEDGMAKYSVGATGQGNKKLTGDIIVKNPATGEVKKYPFSQEYQVFRGSAVISADKMNVVYIGLDNPISVSVPGFPPDKMVVSCSGGAMTGSNGKYVVRPTDNIAVKECVINVSVKAEKGVQKMGAASYRIKTVPAPKIKFGAKEGGKISKVELSVQTQLVAALEGFVFEGVKYDILEWTYYYVGKSGGSKFQEGNPKGKIIPQELKTLISSGRSGDIISINQIRVMGPDGKARTLASGPSIIVQ